MFKELQQAYGFDDVSIVPGEVTINPDMASTEFKLGDYNFDIPVMSSAMDAVSSPKFANLMHEVGGLGVLNLEGIYTRYEDAFIPLWKLLMNIDPVISKKKFL